MSIFSSSRTIGYRDPSFLSFVNAEEEEKHSKAYEVLFHNEALLNIMEDKEATDLNEFIKKPLFSQKDPMKCISLS